jgi:hypothetical protein
MVAQRGEDVVVIHGVDNVFLPADTNERRVALRVSAAGNEQLPMHAYACLGRELDIVGVRVTSGPALLRAFPNLEGDLLFRECAENFLFQIAEELFAPGGYWAQEPVADAS